MISLYPNCSRIGIITEVLNMYPISYKPCISLNSSYSIQLTSNIIKSSYYADYPNWRITSWRNTFCFVGISFGETHSVSSITLWRNKVLFRRLPLGETHSVSPRGLFRQLCFGVMLVTSHYVTVTLSSQKP